MLQLQDSDETPASVQQRQDSSFSTAAAILQLQYSGDTSAQYTHDVPAPVQRRDSNFFTAVMLQLQYSGSAMMLQFYKYLGDGFENEGTQFNIIFSVRKTLQNVLGPKMLLLLVACSIENKAH